MDINGAIGWAPLLPCVFSVSSETNGINNSGYTVGSCLLDDPVGGGTMSWVYYNFPGIKPVAFNCPNSGVNSSGATAINNNLQVVGWYSTGSVQGGYLANYNNCASEVNFPGAIFTTPTGINDTGWVIGTAGYSNSPYFGFLYNTSSHQFTTITPPPGAVNGFATKGLNNNNFWAGWYLDKNNNVVGFYATHPLIPPIPPIL